MKFSAFLAGKRRYLLSPAIYKLLVRNKNKLGRLMRLSLFSMLLMVGAMNILFARDAIGQDLGQVWMQLEIRNEPLIKALKKIQKQTHFTFAYNKKDLVDIFITDLPSGTRTVRETLDQMLKQTSLQNQQLGDNIKITVVFVM